MSSMRWSHDWRVRDMKVLCLFAGGKGLHEHHGPWDDCGSTGRPQAGGTAGHTSPGPRRSCGNRQGNLPPAFHRKARSSHVSRKDRKSSHLFRKDRKMLMCVQKRLGMPKTLSMCVAGARRNVQVLQTFCRCRCLILLGMSNVLYDVANTTHTCGSNLPKSHNSQ
jgi:hypothetical protein